MSQLFFFYVVIIVLSCHITGKYFESSICKDDQFQCATYYRCINRTQWCNLKSNCADDSDEMYCDINLDDGNTSCPVFQYQFVACEDHRRCIPSYWWCDGIKDCNDSSDEKFCLNKIEKIPGVLESRLRAQKWMLQLKDNVNTSREFSLEIHRAIAALYLSDDSIFNKDNRTGEKLLNDLKIHLLAALLRNETEPLSVNQLAMYIQALLVACMNPRSFYGFDLIAAVRKMLVTNSNFTNPFILLTLCNANETLTSKEISMLVDISSTRRDFLFWTDMQALAVTALACANQKSLVEDYSSLVKNTTDDLKYLQNADGSFETLHTTALVIQALFASRQDEEWNETRAITFLLNNQHDDGSFGDFYNTFCILPVLKYKSLLNINHVVCPDTSENGLTSLDEIEDKLAKQIYVQYSLWIEDKINVAFTIGLRVAINTNFFDIMRIAANKDYKYRFQWKTVSEKTYVYAISGINNDAVNGKFWFLHTNGTSNGQIKPFDKGPVELIPRDMEHVIMWYKSI